MKTVWTSKGAIQIEADVDQIGQESGSRGGSNGAQISQKPQIEDNIEVIDDQIITAEDKEAIKTAQQELDQIGRAGGIIEEFDENL